jgi:hypothetical protein
MERDFPEIYPRIASLGWVGFKGAYDEDILNDRINKVRKICRNAAKQTDDLRKKQKLVGRARMYAGLQMGGFAEVFIRRADSNPNGMCALSQKYGFHRAIQLRRERAARELGALRRIR